MTACVTFELLNTLILGVLVHSKSSGGGNVLVQDGTWQREKDTGNFIIPQ